METETETEAETVRMSSASLRLNLHGLIPSSEAAGIRSEDRPPA